MKITLTVFERLVCNVLIPAGSSYYEQEAKRKTVESLSLSIGEYKKFKPFVTTDTEKGLNANWSEVDKAVKPKEIEFSEWLFDKIKESLKKDSDAETLTMDKNTLFSKFVRKAENDEPEESSK